jgi:hypothetical protein
MRPPVLPAIRSGNGRGREAGWTGTQATTVDKIRMREATLRCGREAEGTGGGWKAV